MSFTSSAWLWSGLALALPITLHLLGRGRGRRQLWPSVRLLRETGLAAGARWRPSQPWLLMLRCAVLAAVTLGLADPRIRAEGSVASVWLLEPGTVAPSPTGAVRYLAPGLPVQDPHGGSPVPPDLWSLLAEADRSLPPQTSFNVLAHPWLGGLIGSRPTLRHALHWTSPPATLHAAAPRPPRVSRWLVAATPVRQGDAEFLRAGLTQAAAALHWDLVESGDPSTADLLVGLDRGASRAEWPTLRPGATVLVDAHSDLRSCPGLVNTGCCGLLRLWRCGDEPPGVGLWQDGAGTRVLGQTSVDGHRVLHLATRLSSEAAQWDTAAFVALLRAAIVEDPIGRNLETTIGQALPEPPSSAAAAHGSGEDAGASRSLANLFWALAAGCWGAERWVAARASARTTAP